MATLIAVDGSKKTVEPENRRRGFTLDELYRLLDCDTIEVLGLGNGLTMVMDEHGKYTTKGRNEEATRVVHARQAVQASDWVVGPAARAAAWAAAWAAAGAAAGAAAWDAAWGAARAAQNKKLEQMLSAAHKKAKE